MHLAHSQDVSAADIRAAIEPVGRLARHTPMEHSPALSARCGADDG